MKAKTKYANEVLFLVKGEVVGFAREVPGIRGAHPVLPFLYLAMGFIV